MLIGYFRGLKVLSKYFIQLVDEEFTIRRTEEIGPKELELGNTPSSADHSISEISHDSLQMCG